MPRLLAAQHDAVCDHCVAHLPVSDRQRCTATPPARRPISSPTLLITVATTALPGSLPQSFRKPGADEQHRVAVHYLAVVVDQDHPVAVPVERQPDPATVVDNGPAADPPDA